MRAQGEEEGQEGHEKDEEDKKDKKDGRAKKTNGEGRGKEEWEKGW